MLFKKLFRDFLKYKVQFLSIFLMAFLGIFVFVGINSEVRGLSECRDAYYTGCNLADVWITGRNFDKEDLSKIKKLPMVADASLKLEAQGKARLTDDPAFVMNFLDENRISRMHIMEGVGYETGLNGVWIDYPFAKKRNLSVGDTLTFELENTEFTEVVRGFFVAPEYVYYLENPEALMPSYGTYGVAYFDMGEYPLPDAKFNTVLIDDKAIDNESDLSPAEKAEKLRLEGQLALALDDEDLIVTGKDALSSWQTFDSELKQHDSMSVSFPIVFVLISLLGIITTMSRLLSRQRVQIGTMKALGFSTAKISAHYISYGVVLSLTGGIAGAFCGYNTLPDYIMDMFTDTYILPVMYKKFSAASLIMIILQTLVAALITFYATRRECALIPAEALRPASPKITKQSALEKTGLWKSLGFSMQWNLRDIFRNKIRTLMGMAGVSGCAMLLLSSFGCLDSLKFMTGWMYGEINTARYKIAFEEGVPYETVRDRAGKYEGQMIETAAVTFQKDGQVKTGSLTVLDAGNYMHFQDEDLKHVQVKKDGIGMSYKMAQMLSVGEGDRVTWNMVGEDEEHVSRIDYIYRNPSVQGITMFRKTFEKLDYRFMPTEILTNVSVPESLADEEEISSVQSLDKMMASMDDMMKMMYSMSAILITAAIVLAVVVLYNMGVLSLVEKRREMATLKVLGLQSREIRRILQEQNVWVTVLGIFLGYPAGFAMLGVFFSDMPDSLDYKIIIYPLSYIYTFFGTLALSMLVNSLLSREVESIDMVEALKGE